MLAPIRPPFVGPLHLAGRHPPEASRLAGGPTCSSRFGTPRIGSEKATHLRPGKAIFATQTTLETRTWNRSDARQN